MHTLEELKSGKLTGVTRLSLSANLTTFPMEILSLADTLEILDLSNNQLSEFPDEVCQLTKLKIVFASNNLFDTLPEVLGRLSDLEMIGFKSNQIKHVPSDSLPPKLRWLVLTDNLIETLPDALGERHQLQKLALAGNRISSLPQTFSQLENLELIRISANKLTECPTHLLGLPKLAWVAFSGNPFSRSELKIDSVPSISSSSFNLHQELGKGASGVISKGAWNIRPPEMPEQIAVKVFKGKVTSDGYPGDELEACLKVGTHKNLVSSLAYVDEGNFLALVMELIPSNYFNLGLPPSLESCTRDLFPEGFSLNILQVEKLVAQMEEVFEHLHTNQVCHGDLYAHNTLIDEDCNLIFGDFGAATMYHMLTDAQQALVRSIERRALNYFIEDLLSICIVEDRNSAEFKAIKQKIA